MQNKTSLIGWVVWTLGSCFFLTEYFVRVSTGVLSSHLFNEFHANATAIGLLSAYFYYAYIGMQIPVGILVDRFGVRNLLSLATVLFGGSCILLSQMHVLEIGYLSRFIMGLVGAFAFVGTLKLITVYFPANKFALLSGITQSCGMIGAIIGAAPMAYLFEHIGWRLSFASFGSIFIALGIVMYILIRDKIEAPDAPVKVKSSILTDLKVVLSSPQTWLNCAFIGLMYAPTEVFGEQWGSMFRATVDGISIEKAALQISFIFLGMTIGCPLIGFVSDKIKSRTKVMRISSVMCFILIMLIIYEQAVFGIQFGYVGMCALMFTYGIFNSAIIPSYAVATEIHTRSVSGVALGITNMATVIGGAVFIPIIGHVLDTLAGGRTIIAHDHASAYGALDFEKAFIILPICFVLCFILTFLIKDTRCIAKD